MFGVIKGCGCNFSQAERRAWVSHVCGLCLTLRDNYGQLSRLATNYDAALLSVLTEAQMTQPLERERHLCPIRGRGFQRAEVVTATDVSCLAQLDGIARRAGEPLRVLHLAELLAEAAAS